MAIQPTQPQSIGGVLDTAFGLYKASFARVVPLCLLLVIAGSPPSIYLLIHGPANTADPAAMLAVMQNPGYWLTQAITLVLALWMFGALSLKMRSIGAGEEMGSGAALRSGLARLLPLVVMTILLGLAIAIGLVLLIVPGLILMVSLMLGSYLVLFEGRGALEALTGSHRLVWGHWWRTAAILTVGFIVAVVFYTAATFLFGLLLPLVGIGTDDLVTTSLLSGLLISVVVGVLVTPFYLALLICIYWDLKLRKEGSDLAARVGALNAA